MNTPAAKLMILLGEQFACVKVTRNRASVGDAMRGYKEIHIRALKLLKPGGTLATFCCSHHVDATMFQDVILSAAYDTRRVLRRVAIYAQSPDQIGRAHV